GVQILEAGRVRELQQVVDRADVLLVADLHFGAAHQRARSAPPQDQAGLLEVPQRFAQRVAARLEALAQVHFARQAAADDMDADTNFLAQRFGDFQIARPARRAHAGAVALFLGMALVGSARMFGHNGNSTAGTRTMDTITKPLAERELRGATLCQTLHWLASGRVSAGDLCDAYLAAIARENSRLNAYVAMNPHAADQARATQSRRTSGPCGRLDGVPVSIKDNLDVAGLPTRSGMPATPAPAARDAHVVERLRHAGAVILGKTHVPEGSLNASSANPHTGAAHNPWRQGFQAGGSSGGAAAAVAAGLCTVAIGTDSLGSIRIPASYCGVYALKPTHGEISTHGMVPAARRLDCIGLVARGIDDLGVLLHLLAGYDADDPRSRRRHVDLALPDWEPGKLRAGVLGDLTAFGTEPAVAAVFARAMDTLKPELGECRIVDFGDFPLQRARRAAF